MKKLKVFVTLTIIITTLLASSMPAFAFTDNETRSMNQFFIDTQLLKGDGGNYGLDKPANRLEGVIILIRLMGKEADAQAMKDHPCQFTDVPDWAKGYVNYAFVENITKGVSADRFGVADKMTVYQYNTLMLRVLGYDDSKGDFKLDYSVDKAEKLSILPRDFALLCTQGNPVFTKSVLMETSFCYLQANLKDQEQTLVDQLIEAGAVSNELAEEYGLSVDKWESLTTSPGGSEYFTFDLNGGTMTISGQSDDSEKRWLLVRINNKENGANQIEKVDVRDAGGRYDLSVSVANLRKGEYYVDVYGNDERYNTYHGIVNEALILRVADDDTYFVPSPVYGANLRIFNGNEIEPQDKEMNLETRSDKAAVAEISSLAVEITKDCGSDYQKALAIHDWVAENVYYDRDFLHGRTNSTNITSKSVLDNRYAVCSGYSNLTKDLLSAAGIPSKVIYGYALGISGEDDWGDVDFKKNQMNHAWNEAYVGGRWIIIDATWDSDNKYEAGNFTKGDGVSRLFFDSTVEFLSATHRSLEYKQ